MAFNLQDKVQRLKNISQNFLKDWKAGGSERDHNCVLKPGKDKLLSTQIVQNHYAAKSSKQLIKQEIEIEIELIKEGQIDLGVVKWKFKNRR